MSLTLNTSRKAAVSTYEFATAPIIHDGGDSVTYGTVRKWNNSLITVKNTPKQNSATQSAGGAIVDSYVAKAGGTLDVTVTALTTEDEVEIFGCKTDATSNVTTENKNDIIPDVMVIYSLRRSDGAYNLYKVPKAKFSNNGEQVDTADESGIKFSSTALTAQYISLEYTGDAMLSIKGVDITTAEGKNLYDAWFATAVGGLPAAYTTA